MTVTVCDKAFCAIFVIDELGALISVFKNFVRGGISLAIRLEIWFYGEV